MIRESLKAVYVGTLLVIHERLCNPLPSIAPLDCDSVFKRSFVNVV